MEKEIFKITDIVYTKNSVDQIIECEVLEVNNDRLTLKNKYSYPKEIYRQKFSCSKDKENLIGYY